MGLLEPSHMGMYSLPVVASNVATMSLLHNVLPPQIFKVTALISLLLDTFTLQDIFAMFDVLDCLSLFGLELCQHLRRTTILAAPSDFLLHA
jgi:hypothetical protein